ncbi:DUF2487 family protein [Halalkalibacillus sediminis]|nr:DUF2487 family protein [Halalkalibacillus sediminis]
MKWNFNDAEQYVQAKEYIDTAIIPLIPYSFSSDEDIQKLSFQKEVMDVFTTQIEKELKGRIFLIPEYYYLKDAKIEEEKQNLDQQIEHVQSQPFNHVFLLTFDSQWRKKVKEFDADLLWIPSIKEGNLNQVDKQQLIQAQVEEVLQLIKESWSN